MEHARDAAPVNQEETAKAEREVDPRLTYTPEAKAEAVGLDAQTLPWNSPGSPEAGWNAEEILGKLTQST